MMNKIRKITGAVLCITFIMAFFATGVFAEETPIAVKIDGEQVEFDAQPKIVEERVMVPMRAVFEKLEAQVLWDPFFERVIVNYNEEDQIIMYINDGMIYRNGVQMHADAAPFISESRTYVPLRFIGESLGQSVEWSDALKTVFVVPKEKQMQIIPFGEFLTIPSPYSVNRNYKTLDYKNENGVATATYSLNGEKPSDFERYTAIMTAMGYPQIKAADEKDAKVIYYGKTAVITLELQADNDTFVMTIYQDATGETVKDYIKAE